MKRFRRLAAKYHRTAAYLLFGVLTTVVNWFVYLYCHQGLELSAGISNMIAWIFAVVFAYLTNKSFVFRSHDWSVKTVIPELSKFAVCRVGSGAMETAMIFVTVDCLNRNANAVKLLTGILVVALNYAAGRLLVFRGKVE